MVGGGIVKVTKWEASKNPDFLQSDVFRISRGPGGNLFNILNWVLICFQIGEPRVVERSYSQQFLLSLCLEKKLITICFTILVHLLLINRLSWCWFPSLYCLMVIAMLNILHQYRKGPLDIGFVWGMNLYTEQAPIACCWSSWDEMEPTCSRCKWEIFD